MPEHSGILAALRRHSVENELIFDHLPLQVLYRVIVAVLRVGRPSGGFALRAAGADGHVSLVVR